jgi:hypothetical protein
MGKSMLLILAGSVAMLTAVIHGVLGETKIFAKARIEPAWIRLLLRLIWQCGALAWFGLGVLLVVAADFEPAAQRWIVAVAVVNFLAGAAGNAWVTRGRHVGWMMMVLASGLALAGM